MTASLGRPIPVDTTWLAAELAKAPAHLTSAQQSRLRAILLPVRRAS